MSDQDERQSTPTQRTYGRGVFDGLKLAGVSNPEDVMNNARMKALENGLNGLAKKVYAVIPIQTAIAMHEIIRLLSAHGRPEYRVVQGCIGALIEKGLVYGVGEDRFQRVAPKVAQAPHAPDVSEDEGPRVAAPSSEVNPLERLAAIEGRFRVLIADLTALTGELGTAAIEVEGYIQRVKNDNAKVAQLKELLKSL